MEVRASGVRLKHKSSAGDCWEGISMVWRLNFGVKVYKVLWTATCGRRSVRLEGCETVLTSWSFGVAPKWRVNIVQIAAIYHYILRFHGDPKLEQ